MVGDATVEYVDHDIDPTTDSGSVIVTITDTALIVSTLEFKAWNDVTPVTRALSRGSLKSVVVNSVSNVVGVKGAWPKRISIAIDFGSEQITLPMGKAANDEYAQKALALAQLVPSMVATLGS